MTDSGQKRVLGDIFGRFWYVPDIIVIVLLFLCGAFVYSLPIFEYRAGRHNDGSWAMYGGVVLLKLLLVAIGSVDMEIPQTQPRQRREDGRSVLWDPGEYRLPLALGVYVWHGIPN